MLRWNRIYQFRWGKNSHSLSLYFNFNWFTIVFWWFFFTFYFLLPCLSFYNRQDFFFLFLFPIIIWYSFYLLNFYWFIDFNLLFIYSFIYLFIYLFIHLFIYSFIHLFICLFANLLIYLFIFTDYLLLLINWFNYFIYCCKTVVKEDRCRRWPDILRFGWEWSPF